MATLNEMMAHSRIYDLEQPRYFGAPVMSVHAPGFVYTLHRHHEPGMPETRTSASGSYYSTEHSGTHIDALCHQAEQMYLYGGREITPQMQTPTGFKELGVETIAPISARGVLLDVARFRGVNTIITDLPITQADLAATMQQQGSTIQKGDVVLVRTGNGALWQDADRYLQAGGMSTDASQWLAEQKVRAVGADNVAWDIPGLVDPNLKVSFPGHLVLLVRSGIHIIENLFLEDLASAQQYEFLFICLPLKMRGATGSPVRPVAIVGE